MLTDSKGQISAEYVLLIGLFLVIILVVAASFGQSNEVNLALSTAREGVINASNDIAYSGSGNVVRFNTMSFNKDTGVITVNIASEYPLSGTDITNIETTAIKNMKAGLSEVVNSSDTSVQTKRYTYTIKIINITY
jgi:uncharacterized protein (UPF0333 family)